MKIILLLTVSAYIVAMAYLYFFQNSIVFNSSAIVKEPAFELPDMDHISLKVDDAVLDGVYRHSKDKDSPLLIYFGGNADDATRILLYLQGLKDFDIVAFNYRGYMKSTGKPSEKNLFADALSIYDRYSKNRKVIVIGRSLGTGVATYLAANRKVQGVILITPYDSIASIAKDNYPIFPIDLLLKNRFDSVGYIQEVKAPVSVIEVQGDSVVTKKHSKELMKNVPNLVASIVLHDTTHAGVLEQKDFETTIKDMLTKILSF